MPRRHTSRTLPVRTCSAIAVEAGALPSEIRLFRFGPNETHNGTFTFDEGSAKSVLENFARYGLPRLAIDYDHKSVAGEGPADAGKAAGSFIPEVRTDGLWATDIQWTASAREALEAKEWLYFSPTFETESETGRVLSILNFALTNFPATFGLQPLVARHVLTTMAATATETDGDTPVKDEDLKTAIEAIKNGDGDSALAVLEAMLMAAAGGPAAEAEPAAEAPPAEEMVAAAVEEDEEEEKAETMAATARLIRLSGKPTFVEAAREAEAWRASHLELETERQKLAKERSLFESAERRAGCVRLVTEAGRAPATVWADPKAKTPKKYLAAMSMADFREYVADAVASRGGARPAVAPPVAAEDRTTTHGGVELTEVEVARVKKKAKALGTDPDAALENYAAIKSRQARPVRVMEG